jgi:hypothetical protein
MNAKKLKVVSALVLIGIFIVSSSCNFIFSAEDYRYLCQTQSDCAKDEKCELDKDGNKYCIATSEPLDVISDDVSTQPDTTPDFFLEDLGNKDVSGPQYCHDNKKKICDNAPALPITAQKSIKGDWVAQMGDTEVLINVNCLGSIIDAENWSTMDGHLLIDAPQEYTSGFLSSLTLYLCIDMPETRRGPGYKVEGIPEYLFYGKGKIAVTENTIQVIFDTAEGGKERTYQGTYAIEENGDILNVQLKGILLHPENPLASGTVTFKLKRKK